LFILLFLMVPLFLSISIVVWAIKNGIGPMPTSPKQKQGLFESLPTNLKGNVFDLGSGWGTLAVSLAKTHPDCVVIGYESSPVPYLFSKGIQFVIRYPNLRFCRKNIFDVSLKDASLIVIYLHPSTMKKLKPKLEQEIRSRTFVITNTFAVPDWIPVKVTEVNDIYSSKVYVYVR
jgi:trans-aconitate methyltransferase